MKTQSYICDWCGHDLSSKTGQDGHRLVLDTQTVPCYEPFQTCLAVIPIIDRPYHFCGKSCLREWCK